MKYNFNYDKDSAVFGFQNGDESWETTDNSNDWALFKVADYTGDEWEAAFEARYPDDYNNPANLSQVAEWICSTDPEQATNANLASSVTYEGTTYTKDTEAYRLAKFRNELTDWFNRDDVLFYYLFTELFLMVDSRVKNSFPTLYASHSGAKWCWLPYDMDTAIGINNEGALAFDYSLEDTDMLSPTAGVYNGYQTVMWNNVRRCFPNELQSLYQSVRAEGIVSYDVIEQRFEQHQNTWNEAIFNEDAYFKYIRPFVEDGENNLYMCLGSKAEQRKWWLYNRFRYIDSKYTAGLATSSTLQMRVYQRSDLTVTPYADIYASALFDSNLVKEKAHRGEPTVLNAPPNWNPGGSDAVLRIYSADQIKSLGDLSGFYVGAVSFAAATKLQSVKLGDADAQYQNDNLTDVTFGTNNLLTSVDIRNCPNLTSNIDFSHCENLSVLHMEGTSVVGVTLADGGVLSELYLPDTVTNLTLKNLPYLSTFELNDLSNLTTLWLENIDATIIDGLDTVYNDMATGGRVRLVGFDKTYANDSDFTATMRKMMNMRGIDSDGSNLQDAYLQGEVTVGEINRYIYDNLYRWPFLTVHYTTIGAYDYVLHLQNSASFTEYHDNTITMIRPYAFYNSNVTTMDTPNVTTIGTYAFYGSKVQAIDTTNVTTIGENAFSNAKSVIGLSFPNLTSIPKTAFASMGANVSRFYFPSVTSIAQESFNGTTIRNYNFDSVVSVGFRAFNGASGDDLLLPNIITLGNDQQFRWSNFKKLVFPKLVTMSGTPIMEASSTTHIDFGPTTSINFGTCSSLSTLILRREDAITALGGTLSGTPFASGGTGGTIYIPEALYDHLGDGTSLDYKAASNWSTVDGYGTITWAKIEGSQYENYYANGTPIPQEEE